MPDETCEYPEDDDGGLPAAADIGKPRDDAIPSVAGLVVVATPIGNRGDMTPRAVEALGAADLILCEDTRHTGRLCANFGITTRLLPLHEHNEDSRIPRTLQAIREGRRIALVSDAGTPLVSDPGFRLVRAAIAEGLPVSGVPGANAAVLALVLSGLPPQPFLFQGFPPPRSAARAAAFARLRAAERAGLDATVIWYEAPHRLAEMLADLAAVFGDRRAAVARELTKRFEEVRRGSLPELAAHYAGAEARGEITVIIGPAPPDAPDEGSLDDRLRAALEDASVKQAVARVAAETGLPRRQVYARALEITGNA